eukprot:2604724-Prymnesium_polylepis.1
MRLNGVHIQSDPSRRLLIATNARIEPTDITQAGPSLQHVLSHHPRLAASPPPPPSHDQRPTQMWSQ